MKIAFFGAFGSFDYFKIGGTESFSRRLGSALVKRGHQVDFIVSRAPVSRQGHTDLGIGLFSLPGLASALDTLGQGYDHVVSMYLPPKDRLVYAAFRHRQRQRRRFHKVFFGWPDSLLKRKAGFLEARLYPFNGRIFCISPRIYDYARSWAGNARLLLPPVPEAYFLAPADKANHPKTRVVYIGRTEWGKGIEDVIALFRHLAGHPELHLEIHGFHHPHNAAAVKIHTWLQQQADLRYYYTPLESFSPEAEANLATTLRQTDILILPYQRLSSTIDTPLLLLEGMASLCAVVTRRFGDIPDTYGQSPFLLPESGHILAAADAILQARDRLPEERQRIRRRNAELGFQTGQVCTRFLEAILS